MGIVRVPSLVNHARAWLPATLCGIWVLIFSGWHTEAMHFIAVFCAAAEALLGDIGGPQVVSDLGDRVRKLARATRGLREVSAAAEQRGSKEEISCLWEALAVLYEEKHSVLQELRGYVAKMKLMQPSQPGRIVAAMPCPQLLFF